MISPFATFRWILAKDVRQRLRDRSGLVVALAVPLAMAALIGTALERANQGIALSLGIVAAPDEADAFERWLAQPWLGDDVMLTRFDDPTLARAAVDDGSVQLALHLAPGGMRIETRKHLVNETRIVQALAERYRAEQAGDAAARAAVAPRSPGGELRMIDYFATSMAILFLNFGVLGGVRALQEEKQSGALARLAAAPVSPVAVLAGKFGALLATGALQLAVMVVATSWLFGTRWGEPLPLLVLGGAAVAMAVGLTSFLMALTRDAAQGTVLANTVIFVLAVIGGQFMPPQGLPDLFETLQRLTPNGQAARGLVDLAAAAPEHAWAVIVEPTLFAGGVGVAGIAFGVARARDALTRAMG